MLSHMLLLKVLNHQLITNTLELKVLANIANLRPSSITRPILMLLPKIMLDYNPLLLNNQHQSVLKLIHNNSNYTQLVSSTMLAAEQILTTVSSMSVTELIQKAISNIGWSRTHGGQLGVNKVTLRWLDKPHQDQVSAVLL